MLSDILWRGAFHRHIMMIGGRTATPARTAQLDSVRFDTKPAINTAKTQTVARTALIDMSCMPQGYAPALDGAVPKCTHGPQRSERARFKIAGVRGMAGLPLRGYQVGTVHFVSPDRGFGAAERRIATIRHSCQAGPRGYGSCFVVTPKNGEAPWEG